MGRRRVVQRRKVELIPEVTSAAVFLATAPIVAAWVAVPSAIGVLTRTMKVNTALGLCLGSLALWGVRRPPERTSRSRLLASRVLAVVVAAIGGITLFEYVSGIDAGLDELVATDLPVGESRLFPGRMAPIASTSMLLFGLALLTVDRGLAPGRRHVSSWLQLPIVLPCGLALVGYFYDVGDLYQFGNFIRISWQSALCFFVLTTGLAFARPDHGHLQLLTMRGTSGVLARRLLPLLFAVPLLIGGVISRGEGGGLFGLRFGMAVFTVSVVLTLVAITAFTLERLAALDAERERAAELVRAAQEQTTLVLQSAPVSVWAIDAQGTCHFAGGAALASMERGELVGRNLLELEPAQGGDPEAVRRALAGESVTREIAHGQRWFHTHFVPRRDAEGRVTGIVAVSTDITERRRSEEALREALRARDEFVSIASHELKTPITSMMLQAQLFQRAALQKRPHAYAPEKVDGFVRVVDRQLHRLDRLVSDMLDISRIRAGKLWFEEESFDFAELVRDVTARLSPAFEAAGASMPEVSVPGPVVGRWDRGRLDQVLTNLLTNALRYGKGSPVSVRLEAADDRVTLSVKDRGMGIAPEHQERIFDRFERAVSSRHVSGLGLGLYISRQIVQGHGGRMRVESAVGEGATFFVELPWRREAAQVA